MNVLAQLLHSGRRNLLSIYFTAGYPALDDTGTILRALLNAPVDLIEVGFPFSDPLADGPVIQHSSERALQNGMSLPRLFDQLAAERAAIRASGKPVLLMGYLNPVLQFGVEAFCRQAAAVGVSGVILPDLPLAEYLEEYRSLFRVHDLHFIPLITPQTPEARIRWIDEQADDGFLYLVASSSTTGTSLGVDAGKEAFFQRIQSMNLRHPCLVGFGIHNAAAFQAACRHARGAIIGSAFIQALDGAADVRAAAQTFISPIISSSRHSSFV